MVLSGPCLLKIKPTSRHAGIKSRTPAWLVSSVFFAESFKNVFYQDNEEVRFVTPGLHLTLVAERGGAVLVEGATGGLCHSRSSLGLLSTILSFLSLSHRRSDVWSQGLACGRQFLWKAVQRSSCLSKAVPCISERNIVSEENKFQITCSPANTVLSIGRLVGEC